MACAESSPVYLVCSSTNDFPGLIYIDVTNKHLDDYYKDLNNNPGMLNPFVNIIEKKVHDPKHMLEVLCIYYKYERVRPDRNYFTISPEKLIEGLNLLNVDKRDSSIQINEEDKKRKRIQKFRPHLKDILNAGDLVCSQPAKTPKKFVAEYDAQEQNLIYTDECHTKHKFKSLQDFIKYTYHQSKPGISTPNAWKHCLLKRHGDNTEYESMLDFTINH